MKAAALLSDQRVDRWAGGATFEAPGLLIQTSDRRQLLVLAKLCGFDRTLHNRDRPIIEAQQITGVTDRSDSIVSMPSPAARMSAARPKRTPLPRSMPMARRGVEIGAFAFPDRSSQVRCAPVMAPVSSVTAAISAGQLSRTLDRLVAWRRAAHREFF